MRDIKYCFDKRTENDGLFREIIEYSLKVPCVNRTDILDYIYRLYRFEEHLYITDIFPLIFANDNKCFQKFTSHEGYRVNMRQLAVTCLEIFTNDFISKDKDDIMVISGSYESGETTDKPSRKLRLYWYFFRPLLDELDLDVVDMADVNAFMLFSKSSSHHKETIKDCYIRFKKSQHNE